MESLVGYVRRNFLVPSPRVVSLEGLNTDLQQKCLAGDTGTGKTHLAIAPGIAAIGEGVRVRFVPAGNLVSELLAAAGENQLPRMIRAWRRFGLVICDDLGYIPLSREGAQCLFQLVADRPRNTSSEAVCFGAFSRYLRDIGGLPSVCPPSGGEMNHRPDAWASNSGWYGGLVAGIVDYPSWLHLTKSKVSAKSG